MSGDRPWIRGDLQIRASVLEELEAEALARWEEAAGGEAAEVV